MTISPVRDDLVTVNYPMNPRNMQTFKVAVLAPVGSTDVAARVEEVEFLDQVAATLAREALMIGGALPIPALLTTLVITVAPWSAMSDGYAETYA